MKKTLIKITRVIFFVFVFLWASFFVKREFFFKLVNTQVLASTYTSTKKLAIKDDFGEVSKRPRPPTPTRTPTPRIPTPTRTHTPTPTPITTSTHLPYTAVVLSNKKVVAEYATTNMSQAISSLYNGFPSKKASSTYYLTRVLKNAYGADRKFVSETIFLNTENRNTNVKLIVYNSQGTKVKEITQALTPYGRGGIHLGSLSDLSDGEYSGVLTTDNGSKIVADINHYGSAETPESNRRNGGTEGKPSSYGTKKWFIPILTRNSYGVSWESGIIVQNISDSSVNFNLRVYRSDGLLQKTCEYSNLPSNATRVIFIPNDSCLNTLVTGAQYTAMIESTNNVVVNVSHSSAINKQYIEEEAIPEQLISSNLYTPRVHNEYYNWVSSITVQNACSSTVTVKVDYYRSNDGTLINPTNNSCSQLTLNPNAHGFIYIPNCFSAGNTPISAKVSVQNPTINNNCLAGFYHIARKGSDSYKDTISGGARMFNDQDADMVYYIPRVFKNFYGWNSSINIVNTDPNQQASTDVFILNNQGRVVAKKTFNIFPLSTVDIYIPSHFNLAENILTPTMIPTGYPPVYTCNNKSSGDANCDENINDTDYTIWKCEFLGQGVCRNPSSNKTADFNNDKRVDLVDFEIWRKTGRG